MRIYICNDAIGKHWQLGQFSPIRKGSVSLLGWESPTETKDAGVPKEVATIFSRALASVACVTFLSTGNGVQLESGEQLVRLGRGSFWELFFSFVVGRSNNFLPLLSTRNPLKVFDLFKNEDFPWWQQGQIALLSSIDMPVPKVDRKFFLSLLGEHWIKQVESPRIRNLDAVMRPGVDGDIAGIIWLEMERQKSFFAALEYEANVIGYKCIVLDEDAFAKQLKQTSN